MRCIFIFFFIFTFSSVYSQSKYIKITGKVKDFETGEYLQYVNIYLQNSNIGTVTNNNGEYVLSIKKEKLPDSLVISYVGYNTDKFFIAVNKDKIILDAELKSKINKLNEVKIVEKKPNPTEILKQTYNFLKKHKNKTYKVNYYARECIRFNDKFVYNATGFLKGIISNKVSLFERSNLVTGNLKANDSLLFLHTDTPVVLEIPFMALSSGVSKKRIHNLIKKANIKIDTVIFYSNSKMYVLNIDYNFIENLPSNYDMIVNKDLTKTILKQIKENLSTKAHPSFYKFYIEVTDKKYFLTKTERIYTFLPSKSYKYKGFVKIESYFKILDDNSIIPNYQNCFRAYIENDTIKYYDYSDYVITKIDTVNVIDKDIYNNIYNVFPMYLGDKEYVLKQKKDIKIYNNPEFNYIKKDSLQKLINKDLK